MKNKKTSRKRRRSGKAKPPAHCDNRLSEFLARFAEYEGSFVQLAYGVSEANGWEIDRSLPPGEQKTIVDRRKLARVVESPDTVTVTFAELRAIDRYLQRFGYSLAQYPLFYRPAILKRLADAECVKVFLGARPGEPRDTLAVDDFEAMSALQNAVFTQNRKAVRFEPHSYVLVEDDAELRTREWMSTFGKYDVVSLGSSRSNHLTERLLAELFAVPPFAEWPVDLQRVPFNFVWSDGAHVFPSHFSRAAAAGAANGDSAIHVQTDGGAVVFEHRAPVEGCPGKTYGIVAGCVRENGQLVIVLAGLTGTGTHGTALALDRLAAKLDEAEPGRPSPTFWALVEVGLADDPDRPGREKIVSAEIVGDDVHIVERPKAA